MIRDFRDYCEGARIETDLCVIGAGPAGIALAREFLGSSTEVLLLDSGGLRRDEELDALNEAENVGLEHHSEDGRLRRFGGASWLWAGLCVPFADIDFEPRDWVPHSGWPIRRVDLDPYYRRAEAFFHIEGERYDDSVARRFGIDPPQVDPGSLAYGVTVLTPRPDLGRLYRGEVKKSRNVASLLHATAFRIRANESEGTVDHIEIASPDGRRGQVRAKAFALCAGGIENARMLLASDLGNRHDLVGRFLQEHPGTLAAQVEADDPVRLQEIFGLLYDRGGIRYLPKLGLTPEFQRRRRVLNCDAKIEFEYGASPGEEAAKRLFTSLRRRRWSPEVPGDLRETFSHPLQVLRLARRFAGGRGSGSEPTAIVLQTNAEQVPNPDSRVTLSERTDRLGVPLARVDWRMTDLDRRTTAEFTNAAAAELERLGLARLRPAEWVDDPEKPWASSFYDAYHHIGTTRMSSDETRGVVDENCAVHGCRGLYVSGSSVFPTSGRANPTLTIVAMAIRLADHLKRATD